MFQQRLQFWNYIRRNNVPLLALNHKKRVATAFWPVVLNDLRVNSLQIDELWAKVGCRQFRTELDDPENGDFYSFLAIDAETKLIAHYFTGKRNKASTDAFICGLSDRIIGRPQITTDGWYHYPPVIHKHFNRRMDYATVQKLYASDPQMARDMKRRYSPPVCTGIRIAVESGQPLPHRISTSYVERANLSVRHFNKRFARLSLGYSKKLLNHRFAVALFIAHYNFCKIHSTLSTSPACAHKLTGHVWSTTELLNFIAETN